MEENLNKKYNIKRLIKVFDDISATLNETGGVEYIALTPNEFSIYINRGVSMILINELEQLEFFIFLDAIFFNEHIPQLVITNTMLQEYTPPNEDVLYLINFVKDCAEFICPCTGSEIHISDNEVRIFIDQVNLSHDEYIGVYNLMDNSNCIFKTVFDIQRPYISIMGGDFDG